MFQQVWYTQRSIFEWKFLVTLREIREKFEENIKILREIRKKIKKKPKET